MSPLHWHRFFLIAAEVLGAGHFVAQHSQSWCAWTTFGRLGEDAGYWTRGLPARDEVFETHIGDGGVWGQPFDFSDLAHLIVPREFYWETAPGPEWACGSKRQDIMRLSQALEAAGVPHRLTELVLEVKCY
jgi:hypothetical protein